jgi:hypothetical protein
VEQKTGEQPPIPKQCQSFKIASQRFHLQTSGCGSRPDPSKRRHQGSYGRFGCCLRVHRVSDSGIIRQRERQPAEASSVAIFHNCTFPPHQLLPLSSFYLLEGQTLTAQAWSVSETKPQSNGVFIWPINTEPSPTDSASLQECRRRLMASNLRRLERPIGQRPRE